MFSSVRLFTALLLSATLLSTLSCKDRTTAPPPDANPGATPSATPTTEVRIAAAADLKFALDEVIAEFQKLNPTINTTATYGSSGTFYSQLSNKATFDIFFSADIDYPRRLIAAGHALNDSLFKYAIGHIVVWVRSDSPLDVKALGIEALADPSVRKIAIAKPEHAPYGRAAEAAMKSLGVFDRVEKRLVFGENIAHTAQFVESGAADIGIIALSLALSPAMKDKGTYWTVPVDSYPQLVQAGVILSWARDLDATQQFKAFVTGPDGRSILKRFGFVLPGE